MQKRRAECIAEAQEVRTGGGGPEEALSALKARDASSMDGIQTLQPVFGLPYADAKRTFHSSKPWADERCVHAAA